MALLLSGCMTQNGKMNLTLRYLHDNPEFTAGLCADKFKTNQIYKPGTIQSIPGPVIIVEEDSVPCPDGTKKVFPSKRIQCPPSSRQVDTVRA